MKKARRRLTVFWSSLFVTYLFTVSLSVNAANGAHGLTNGEPIDVSGGSAKQRRAVQEAVAKVDAIWKDDHFWDIVAGRSWLPSPTEAPLPGKVVADVLRSIAPAKRSYRLVTMGWGMIPLVKGGTIGKTDACRPTYLNKKHMDPSYLVNTVAHENTHSLDAAGIWVGCSDGNMNMFKDNDYSDRTKAWLVSYGIGDLAQCYADNNGNSSATLQCFDSNINGQAVYVNGAPASRTKAECCYQPNPGEHLCDIPERLALCAAAGCSPPPRCPRTAVPTSADSRSSAPHPE